MDKFTKRGMDGSVDVVASAQAYASALTKWAAENEIAGEKIENAVEAVFDQFPGQTLPMPALLNLSVAKIGGTPEQHKTLTNRVHAYVSGQCNKNTGRLEVSKGKGGGVLRLAKPGQTIPARSAKKSA